MFGLSPRPVARRALLEDIDDSEKRSWLSHGIAALGVSLLGLAVAGSVALTSSASSTEEASSGQDPAVTKVVSPGVNQPSAFDRRGDGTSRDSSRADVTEGVKQRTKSLQETDESVSRAAESAALESRKKQLQADATANAKASKAIEAKQAEKKQAAIEAGADPDAAEALAGDSSGGSKPLASYTIAARFGAMGPWSRYHTGMDFSAPIGTPIHAAAAGVVTHSGFGGEAGGWAGNYVTVQHADGTQSLYAHTGGGTVSVGQSVTAGQVIAHVGMTGRTFGAHLHFEIYPAGVTPGDIYSAIDPSGWFSARGVGI